MDGGSATISGNTIYDNGTGIRFTNGGTGSVSGNAFDDPTSAVEPDGDADNGTDLRLDSSAGTVTIGSNNQFAGDAYYIDNRFAQNFNLVGTGTTFDYVNNFRIEDRMFHALDAAASGLITWVTANRYVTTPGTGASDETIQAAVNAANAGDTINIEAGTYPENVTVSKSLTLDGAGTLATDVVISASGGSVGLLISNTMPSR